MTPTTWGRFRPLDVASVQNDLRAMARGTIIPRPSSGATARGSLFMLDPSRLEGVRIERTVYGRGVRTAFWRCGRRGAVGQGRTTNTGVWTRSERPGYGGV